MPDRRSAAIVKSAVCSISMGCSASPTGTQKNRNSSGNRSTRL
jgi:hypothetical protein